MKTKHILTALLLIPILGMAGSTRGESPKPFADNVNMQTGAIQVPDHYTAWPILGTWSHASEGSEPGAKEFHTVYTQPETIDYYQRHERFPDGAVLVKELLTTQTLPMTTGPAVSHAANIKGWFVLVRDTRGRFRNSKLWGNGWGWSYFEAGEPRKTISTDYQNDCMACHLPARQFAPVHAEDSDKWIYTFGYPVLQRGHIQPDSQNR